MRRKLVVLGLLVACMAPSVALAAPKDKSVSDSDRESSRVHFRKGIKLFQDGNFVGALAEFQASYKLKPAGSTLQNIALCQKQLFRYSEAAETLADLLKTHGSELTEEEKTSVRQTMEELEGLVGRVSISVIPSSAKVSVDGRTLTPEQLSEPVRLNVGEHRIRVESPGYAPVDQTVRIASGDAAKPYNFELRAVKGFVEIVASDAGAAIAIDGQPMAYKSWSGPVEPGKRLVQVYKEGHKPFEKYVDIEVGRTLRIDADIGPGDSKTKDVIVDSTPDAPPSKPPPPEQRGWYGLVSLNALGLSANPSLFDTNTDNAGGGSFGIHGGYRVWSPIGIEGLIEGARHNVQTCVKDSPDCTQGDDNSREYSLNSFRVGTNLRLFSSGQKLRFSGALGFGLVRQALELKDDPTYGNASASGFDSYFMIELGAQYNAGHWLFGLAALGYFNGTTGINDETINGQKVYEQNGLITGGIGFRVGWSAWEPN
ncbi:MAG: PEGA domain-containing protein [Polyangiaceae bacterium]